MAYLDLVREAHSSAAAPCKNGTQSPLGGACIERQSTQVVRVAWWREGEERREVRRGEERGEERIRVERSLRGERERHVRRRKRERVCVCERERERERTESAMYV